MRKIQAVEINFKAVFENMPGKNILLLPNPPFFTIAAISNSYCRSAGLTRQKAIGKGLIEIFAERIEEYGKFAIENLNNSLDYVILHKEPHTVVLRELSSSILAARKYIKASHFPILSEAGEILYIIHHVTVVKETYSHKEAEERWQIALDSAELGTWDFYPLKNELICSPRTKALFGLPAEAPVSLEILMNAIHERDRTMVYEEIEEAMRPGSKGIYRVEYEVTGIDDHKERWQRATGQAFFNDEGVAYRLTGTVLDVTDAKRVEEALEERVYLRTLELLNANKELERSNQELEQYAYVASHDLQEPLRKILVYTDLLKKRTFHHAADVDKARLDKIIFSAQRMSHLIQDLLNFSRQLKSENNFSKVDLNYIVRNVADDLELKILETGAILQVDVLPVIEASPQQMNQLFYNLLNNALKFKKENQPPRITITAVVLPKKEVVQYPDLTDALSYIDIRVCDNGIGFNAKYARLIFEIFKRLHTRVKFEGTGIGLALCRKITRNHKGDIYAESNEGEGATFHVLLPLKQA